MVAEMANERHKKDQDRENLRNIVIQWNANRLDLFALSEPNEDLEFHGVMRFYFQDDGQKVATKCIRVSSTGTTKDVILILIEKFRPDMRMLSVPQYALYEIHENGEERKLASEEKPLLVQLNWHKDDREGRFLLRRMDQKTQLPQMDKESSNFKRKLSKREKKEKKRKEKKDKMKNENDVKIAEKLYTELPETSFTRSISNPEAVMRRRRQQKLERKLQQLGNQDDAVGGTLKIFGESLCKDVPYRTLLLSLKDNAAYVVREILEKYGYEKEDPATYCLVQHIVPHPLPGNVTGSMKEYHSSAAGPKEYILDDDDCPLAIDTNFPKSKGVLTFHVKRRPADYQPRKRKKKPKPNKGDIDQSFQYDEFAERLPFLLELNPDGSDITNGLPKKHYLHLNVTEVGCERSHATGTGQHLQLFGPNVQPRHCVLAHTEGIVTVTPSSRDAETYVNGMRIYETTILQHGIIVRFGKIHNFRFIDPLFEEKRCISPDSRQVSDSFYDRASMKDQSMIHGNSGPPTNFETTFDVDGNVETISTHSSQMIQPKMMDADRMSRKSDDLSRSSVRMDSKNRGCDPILPAVLEFKEDGEDMFLNAVISRADTVNTQFKLAPTYTLYMAARYRASTHYRPDMSPNERAHRLTSLMNKVSSLVQLVVQDTQNSASSIAFWIANSSELLHFLKQDRHLSAYTIDAQDLLAECVQVSFKSLVNCLQAELQHVMPLFLEDRDDMNEDDGTTVEVLRILASTMALLRRCRVNAALIIQLFSQLFHFVNMWLFNRIVCDPHSSYCSHLWGVRLKHRLARVEIWAEEQGLELAADCRLNRIVQAANLLKAPKSNPEDFSEINSSCFKLNSLQLRTLFEKYKPAPDEPPISTELLLNVIKEAENTADELTRSDGREVRLEEDQELQLPFLLPEDGYSCDIVRGVPAGLQEFLYPHVSAGLCRMAVQPTSSGYWTIYMSDQDIGRSTGARSPNSSNNRVADGESSIPPNSKAFNNLPKDPEIAIIKLKKSNNGMGLSIVAAKGAGQDKLGIYIKSVVKGGAADADGRLQAGDQLLRVDGHSLIGISQEKAAEYMTRTGNLVNLEVARQGAIYHGLATLLNQPSPIIHRGSGHPGPRRMSERNLSQPPMDERIYNGRIQSSKSVPTLYNNDEENSAPGNNPARPNSRPQDIYNPGYSRTSSTISIPKSTNADINTDGQVRSRSVNSMKAEGQYSRNAPAPASGGPPPYCEQDTMEKPSHRSHPNIPGTDEQHYQNLSRYQQAPPMSPLRHIRPGFDPHNRNPAPLPHQMQPNHMYNPQAMNQQHMQPRQNYPPSPGGPNRPFSTLVSQREHDHYVKNQNVIDQSHPDRMNENNKYASTPEISESPHHLSEHPQWNNRGHPPAPNPTMSEAKHRDIVRQEAKMEEIHEEVQRREERMAHNVNNQMNRTVIPEQMMNNAPSRPPPLEQYSHGPPPPSGPKPNRPNYHPQNYHPLPPYIEHDRIKSSQSYRDSPPPPPPPVNTHPLMQQHPQKVMHPNNDQGRDQLDYQPNYQPPGGPPFRLPPHPEKAGMVPGISPWEREEKERMQQRKIEEARNLRDREINHLENLETLTEKQEVRLRTLRLEKEFQRRAEELNQDDEEEDEEEKPDYSKIKDPSRIAPTDGRYDSSKNIRYIPELEDIQNPNMVQRSMTPQQQWLARKQQEKQKRDIVHEPSMVRNESKAKVIDEVSRKKELEQAALRELQMAKEAEDKLLLEARRRQQVEDSHQQNMFSPPQMMPPTNFNQHMNNSHKNHVQQYSNQPSQMNSTMIMQSQGQTYENNTFNQPDPQHNVQYRSVYQTQRITTSESSNMMSDMHTNRLSSKPLTTSHSHLDRQPSNPNSTSGSERLDSLLMFNPKSGPPPQPPERKSSYEITAELSPNSQNSIKKVSFSDPKLDSNIKYDTNGNQELIKETYYTESIETPPSSPPSSNLIIGSTPGVIGAQEVYRDPRKQIQAQRDNMSKAQRGPGPEELSFKDKMKKFALEAGQNDTPRDRVKISRAQRDIENKVNGAP